MGHKFMGSFVRWSSDPDVVLLAIILVLSSVALSELLLECDPGLLRMDLVCISLASDHPCLYLLFNGRQHFQSLITFLWLHGVSLTGWGL